MKKILLILTFFGVMLSAKSQITDSAVLRAYINANFVPNGVRSITGTQLNNAFNGMLNVLGTFNFDTSGFSLKANKSTTITINGVTYDLSANRNWTVGDVRTDGSYTNPSWIASLVWSKITGKPTTLSGYGITDGTPSNRTITINGNTQDLSANRSWTIPGTRDSVEITQNDTATFLNFYRNDTLVFTKEIPPPNCPINFADVEGGVTDNAALANAFAAKEDYVEPQGLLDINMYYRDGYKHLRNFNDDVRSALKVTYDSSSKYFTFPDTSNLANFHGNINNYDTAVQKAGFYRWNVSTTGSKPGNGFGFYILQTQGANYFHSAGASNSVRWGVDGATGFLFSQVYNNPSWSNITLFAPIKTGDDWYIPLVRNGGVLPTPTGLNINIGVNASGLFNIRTPSHNISFDTSLLTGTARNYKFGDCNNCEFTMMGNAFNGASQLVQLNSSGYLPALDARNLINLPYTAVSGSTAASMIATDANGALTTVNQILHAPVKYATAAALPANTYNNGTSGVGATITEDANGALSIDSNTPNVGDLVLIKNETTGANNGIYVVTAVGDASNPFVLTRETFSTAGYNLKGGNLVYVVSGTQKGYYAQTNNYSNITVGATSLNYIPISTTGITITTSGVLYPASNSFSLNTTTGAFTGALTLNTQSANTVFAGPTSGGAATPTFRGLVVADIPSLSSLYAPITYNAKSFLVNKTNSSAAATFENYYDPGWQTYAGTITWDGTAPTTISSQKYHVKVIGNDVWLTIIVRYTNAGATNTTCTLTLPSDCPLPDEQGGMGAANEMLYPGSGGYGSSYLTVVGSSKVALSEDGNAGDTTWVIGASGNSSSAKAVWIDVHYTTTVLP